MTSEPVTAVEAWRLRRRWKVNLLAALAVIVLVLLPGRCSSSGSRAAGASRDNSTPHYADIVEHFKYGSIGAEPSSGIPYAIWKVLPALYPDEFEGRNDYSAFGFLYETDEGGQQRDLPIGVSQRKVRGVDVVWLNCATCHTGTWRARCRRPRTNCRGDAFQQSRLRPLRAHGLPAVDRRAPGARPPVPGDGGAGYGARRARQADMADRRPARFFAKACCRRAPACCR